MHRTQLYLDDDLWATLQARAHQEGISISELVRVATRDRYMNAEDERRAAVEGFFGIRADRPEFEDVDGYIRNLRRGDRRRKMLAR
jgi:hypothetical protein